MEPFDYLLARFAHAKKNGLGTTSVVRALVQRELQELATKFDIHEVSCSIEQGRLPTILADRVCRRHLARYDIPTEEMHVAVYSAALPRRGCGLPQTVGGSTFVTRV